MFPKVSSRSLRRDNQEFQLPDLTQLEAETVSIAFQVGEERGHCLRLLEFGRGIIMGFAIDHRSDLSGLRLGRPDMFHKFNHHRIENDPLLIKLETEVGDHKPTYEP